MQGFRLRSQIVEGRPRGIGLPLDSLGGCSGGGSGCSLSSQHPLYIWADPIELIGVPVEERG